ncbi:hypothetical protein L3W68_22000, partial [Escherichia coli]|nr:hypothetical protein [Escherichia coli]
KKLIMLPSETMIWQPEFTDKTLSRKPGAVQPVKQLPVMGGGPLNRAQALAKIAEIKAKFGLKGASV